MKIVPVSSPHTIAAPISGGTTEASSAARDRAIAAAIGQQQAPVNQNKVSVEELGAVTVATQEAKPTEIAPLEEKTTQEATETVQPPAQDPALQRQFAQLARQERALRAKAQQQETQLRQREEAIKARESELTAKDNQYRDGYISRERLKQDALAVMEAEGISYDELTQQVISRQPTDPRVTNTISRLEAKIAQLEEKATADQKATNEQATANYQAAVKQITQDAKDLVKSDPEFEAIRATGTVRDVVELITKTHAATGKVLSVEEAAKMVEAEIIEEGLKLTRIEKIKQRMNQPNASANTSTQKTQAQAQTQTQMKTLTNAASSSRQLTARERAVLAFKGELKS